jgi:Lon protease-like protein
MNIECVGYQRFRIQEVIAATPYMVGAIEMIPPLEVDAPNVPDLTRTLRALLPRYFVLLSRATGNLLPSDPIPTQGDALAYWTAIVAPLDNVDKQSLLEYMSLSDLLGAEIALIRKETMLLNSLMYVDSHNHDDTPGFSPN